jgi:hypothetical protein
VDLRPIFSRLHETGFQPLPLPSATAQDDGLLWYRFAPSRIDTIAAWGPYYAAGLAVPPVRNWARPFEPSTAIFQQVGTLEDVLEALLKLE